MEKLSDEIVEAERMLKALIKSLEKKPLNPVILETLRCNKKVLKPKFIMIQLR